MYGLKQLLVLALAGSAAAGCICQSQKGPRSGTDKQATKKACLENSGSWDERPNYYTASYHYRAGVFQDILSGRARDFYLSNIITGAPWSEVYAKMDAQFNPREKKGWKGPYNLEAIEGNDVTISLQSGPTKFRATHVKPFFQDETEEAPSHEDNSDLDQSGQEPDSLLTTPPDSPRIEEETRTSGRQRRLPGNLQNDHLYSSFPTQERSSHDYRSSLYSRNYGPAFIRPSIGTILSIEVDKTVYEGADQDLAQISAHLDLDMDVDTLSDVEDDILVLDEEVGADLRMDT
ncbi:reverse transcriptase-like protein [Venturia nashicola]|uniref:Reverse transcriptase-like protein n=1 Tax=Venturia nashicola TaxID=86259 RepID=A0A4Z1PA38_9PEZI|nr:reverse transcriptase-like protein [Venturia nashicola]